MKRSSKKRKTKRLYFKWVLGILAILVLGIGTYAFTIYNNAKGTVQDVSICINDRSHNGKEKK